MKISVILLTGNEEKVIAKAVESISSWCSELILVCANSTDSSESIVKKIYPKVKVVKIYDSYGRNFSAWRNAGLSHVTNPWVIYLDADEIISNVLQTEISSLVKDNTASHYAIPRANYFLGQRVYFGNTFPDYQKRLFKTKFIKKWEGTLHESPIVSGKLGYTKTPMYHFTHRDLSSMVDKTNIWTDLQAENLALSNHPSIQSWRLFRIFITKFVDRYIRQQMFRDGAVGLISSIFESYDSVIIYSKLWEKQHENFNL